jgi:exodeoxyribonuclease VII small subunit
VADKKNAQLSFEDALAQLESIVDRMESGEVPLAELMTRFEEGSKLLKLCETRLKDAELKIELLKKQSDGATYTAFTPTPES